MFSTCFDNQRVHVCNVNTGADSRGGRVSADGSVLRQHSLAAAAATADGQFTGRFLLQANIVEQDQQDFTAHGCTQAG